MKNKRTYIIVNLVFCLFFMSVVLPASEKDISGLILVNPPFDPDRPTIFAFGGGDCVKGAGMEFFENPDAWYEKTNFFTVDKYQPPYEDFGDMLVAYLSSEAPNYNQMIQTIGFSTGCNPAMTIALHINRTYNDDRYAVNRVTLLDGGCRDYSADAADFSTHPVNGEIAWVDSYHHNAPTTFGILNVWFQTGDHGTPASWYINSTDASNFLNGDMYNHGVTGGAYLSVIGPGKNLQISSGHAGYYFKWVEGEPGYLTVYGATGVFPEPVTLFGPGNGSFVDDTGALFTCKTSENAVGYRLLFGSDPHHMDRLISDTPKPPVDIITSFPYETTFWTIKAYDALGSTIFADPRYVKISETRIQPDVSITSPQNNAAISGTIDIQAEADDPLGIRRVDFYIDGVLKHSAADAPYHYNWDTNSYSSENHIIKVTAYNNANQHHSTAVVVKVRNMVLSLDASSIVLKSWLISKIYDRLNISCEYFNHPPVAKFIIYRRDSIGPFLAIDEIQDTQFQNGTYTYFDKSILEEKNYTYRFTAVDSNGHVLATSNESECSTF
jgi:hypothetical protein